MIKGRLSLARDKEARKPNFEVRQTRYLVLRSLPGSHSSQWWVCLTTSPSLQKLLERRKRHNGPERLQIDIIRRVAQCPVCGRKSTHISLGLDISVPHEIHSDRSCPQARASSEQAKYLLGVHLVTHDPYGAPAEEVLRRTPKRCNSQPGDIDVVDNWQLRVGRKGLDVVQLLWSRTSACGGETLGPGKFAMKKVGRRKV